MLYPEDFHFALPFEVLRSGEDTDVHVLWQAVPSAGGVLLAAEFPRSYIDVNREADDIDVAMLAHPWPEAVNPTDKTKMGNGLIWKVAGEGPLYPIYDRKLTVKEVKARINHFYQPYHAALKHCIEQAYARFGGVWHLNLHSMPSHIYLNMKNPPPADFILGDRDGTAYSTTFREMVASALREKGYKVAINDPYKEVTLVARQGWPQENRHSLQIEVNRGLYMDEKTRQRSSGFNGLQADLSQLIQEIAAYIQNQISTPS